MQGGSSPSLRSSVTIGRAKCGPPRFVGCRLFCRFDERLVRLAGRAADLIMVQGGETGKYTPGYVFAGSDRRGVYAEGPSPSLLIPSLCIFDCSVVRFMPNLAAAPPEPETTPPVCRSTC